MNMNNIMTRRTIRKYSTKDVEKELLDKLLEQASRTQTMGNMQLYSVVVTRSDEGKKALAPAHFNQPMVTSAPVVLTICADFRRATDWCMQRNADPGYDNFLSFINASTDALLFTQTFCCLAEGKILTYTLAMDRSGLILTSLTVSRAPSKAAIPFERIISAKSR